MFSNDNAVWLIGKQTHSLFTSLRQREDNDPTRNKYIQISQANTHLAPPRIVQADQLVLVGLYNATTAKWTAASNIVVAALAVLGTNYTL